MEHAEYTGAAPWFRVWHGNAERRHYLNNLADLVGLIEDRNGYRLAATEVTQADAEAIQRAVIWVDSAGRVHVDDWSSRWLKKKQVASIVHTAIEAHEQLIHVPRSTQKPSDP